MKIVTYNLRCIWDRDEINGFIHRMGLIWDTINREKPDIIGFQEVTPKILEALKCIMPDYIFVGQRRGEDGEGLYTAIKKDTVELVGFESFWIGPEPYEPGSHFEDQGKWLRICVMSMLKEIRTGNTFRVYNLHLDSVVENARVEGINCVWEQIKRNNAKKYFPTIVLGDFNAEPNSKPIEFCRETGVLHDLTENIPYTQHNYGRGINGKEGIKIDYIFVTKEFVDKVKTIAVWKDTLHGIYLSDHYPVSVELNI